MPEVLWYYAKTDSRNDQPLGPVSPAELKQLAVNRALLPEDLIWREGMEGWAPAAKVKGLFSESRESVVGPQVVNNGPAETMPPTVLPVAGAANALPATPSGSGVPADVFAAPSATPPADSQSSVRSAVNQSGEQPGGLEMVDLLWLAQVVLWTICIATVLVGGLLFTRAFATSHTSSDQAAAAAVFLTFFVGAYVVARSGERVAALLQSYFERRRK